MSKLKRFILTGSAGPIRPIMLGIAAALSVLGAPTARGAAYQVLNLGSLGSGGTVSAGINASGQVTGYSTPGTSHAFLTGPLSVINQATDDLGFFGGTLSRGYGVNDLGQVAGNAYVSIAAAVTASHGFRSAAAGIPATDLGSLGGPETEAQAINNAGQVVGASRFSSSSPVFQAFRTAPNATINPATDNLGSFIAGGNSFASGINSAGQVVGNSDTASSPHAFRTTPGGFITASSDLGILPGAISSSALGINNSGATVGYSDFTVGFSTVSHAFFVPGNRALIGTDDLGSLGGATATSTIAEALNNLDVVVGRSNLTGGQSHAFIWFGSGSIIDLNTLIPANSGWILGDATDINDAGNITGTGTFNGVNASFVLTIPEPGTLSFLVLSVIALMGRRKTRYQA